MVKLLDDEVRTREVRGWKGLHLFHATLSSCSQKLRIYLREKGVVWESHLLNLAANENLTEFYLGVNPRGLVPALVDDGDVHIESNDVILHLEGKYPEPKLVPVKDRARIADLLRHEDDLHAAIRTVTFRFVFDPPTSPKSAEDLDRYARYGADTVGGVADKQKSKEIAFWRNYADNRISDEAAIAAVADFRRAFLDLDARLARDAFLLGDNLSILDIAWFVYVNRLAIAGYPIADLHPNLERWFQALRARPHWAAEVALPPPLAAMAQQHQARLAETKRRMVDVCNLAGARP